jgi:tannase/feruloyl esterase
MRRTWPRASIAIAAAMLAGGMPLAAQNGSQFRDWKSTALADTAAFKPREACAALTAMTGGEFSIATAEVVPADADAPEHCRVSARIQPEIRFEVRLPAAWNGRLYMFGNGGYAGESLDSAGRVATAKRALARGFAAAQTNTGHDAATEPLGTFAANPQKFVDYAYRAVHLTAASAKQILRAYYGDPLRHAYFDGCSTGGRQGLISAQRFPEDFDGIVVGAPVLNFSGTMIDYVVNQRALAAAPIPPAKLRILGEAVYAKCDAADGVADRLIDDPRRCRFAPSSDLPRCADADGPACFTADQIRALETIYGGVTRRGATAFPGWPVGAEAAWAPWFVSPGSQPPIQIAFAETFLKYIAFGQPNASYDWKAFDVDEDFDKLAAARAALDAVDPDLSRFKARGGKIVSYYGWADPALNPLMGVGYYENVTQKLGAGTSDFYRLFMVPGMYHCSGGVGVSTFDAFTPLVEWVEKGSAPRTITGARVVDGKIVRTRPLCPYPEAAIYDGSGSIDDASSFRCGR